MNFAAAVASYSFYLGLGAFYTYHHWNGKCGTRHFLTWKPTYIRAWVGAQTYFHRLQEVSVHSLALSYECNGDVLHGIRISWN